MFLASKDEKGVTENQHSRILWRYFSGSLLQNAFEKQDVKEEEKLS
jgi:hypothetical protein